MDNPEVEKTLASMRARMAYAQKTAKALGAKSYDVDGLNPEGAVWLLDLVEQQRARIADLEAQVEVQRANLGRMAGYLDKATARIAELKTVLREGVEVNETAEYFRAGDDLTWADRARAVLAPHTIPHIPHPKPHTT